MSDTTNMIDADTATDNDLMLAACRNDQDEMLEDILGEGDFDINHRDGRGDTALHYVAKYGSLSCLEILLKVPGINVNMRNKQGNTPLHLAVQYEDDYEVALNMVDLLIDAGADPRIENDAKSTVATYVMGRNDDMKELIDQAMAGYEMGDSDEDD
ncbi:ankyrin repeat-containing domain protein [Pilobolus umbonatus]|nr:ankyrin repeat-containing domain protein [Pilobolus umbonatus]